MKKHLLHIVTVLLLGVGLMVASCSKDDTVGAIATDPIFPVKVTPTVEAGMSYTLDIEADRDWEISIPTSGDAAKWFWIEDGSQRVYKLRGTAGKSQVVIHTIELADYDSHHTCDVEMSMLTTGGVKSQVVATITIGLIERTMVIYNSQIDQDGDYVLNPDRDLTGLAYLYEATPATETELIWPVTKNLYAMPILVEGNFNWAIRSKLPEWLNVSVSTGGVDKKTEIRLMAVASDIPVGGTSVTLEIGDEKQTFPFTVVLPNSELLYRRVFTEEALFNSKGEIFNSQGGSYTKANARGTMVYAEGLVSFRFAEKASRWSSPYLTSEAYETEWINVYDGWKKDEGSVQSCVYEVGVAFNEGDLRRGVIIALPKILAAKITDPDMMVDGNEVREEYKAYVVTNIVQESDPGPIAPSESSKVLASVMAKFTKLSTTDNDYNFVSYDFPTAKNIYRAIYAESWSHEDWKLVFTTPYAKVKCFEYDAGDMLIENPNWLSYWAKGDQIRMDVWPVAKKRGVVVFYDAADEIIGLVYSIFDNEEPFGDDGPSFAYPEMAESQGSTIEAVTSGPIFDQYSEHGVPIWHVKFMTEYPSMSMMKGLTMYSSWLGSDEKWVDIEFGGDSWSFAFTPNKGTGAFVFYKDGMMTTKAMVLVITAEY